MDLKQQFISDQYSIYEYTIKSKLEMKKRILLKSFFELAISKSDLQKMNRNTCVRINDEDLI